MKKVIFKGCGVALVTPFVEEGIDFDKVEELIRFHIEEGTDALIMAGTTGESSTLSDEEYRALLNFAVKKVKGRIPVIAGSGSNNTNRAIEKSKWAQEAGCDGVLLVTPYYNKATQKGLYDHFKKIAESITIPVILYNVPSRTALNMLPETVQKLSKIENIVGVKECHFAQVGDIINLCEKDFAVYTGEDALILPTLSMGGMGAISVMANIIPKDTHQMIASFFEGNITKSRQLQLKTLDLIKALFIETSPIPIKAAMNLRGTPVGKCRMPLTEIEEKNLDVLRDALKDYYL